MPCGISLGRILYQFAIFYNVRANVIYLMTLTLKHIEQKITLAFFSKIMQSNSFSHLHIISETKALNAASWNQVPAVYPG